MTLTDAEQPRTAIVRARAAGEARPVAVVWMATALFSTGPVMIAAASVGGVVFSFWRIWAGIPLLAGAATLQLHRSPGRTTRRGIRIALLAGAAFSVHQITLMMALRTTSVVDVTLMNTLAPIAVAMLAVPMFGERPGFAFRAWSAVAIAGAAAVALAGSAGPEGHPAGMALAAVNVLFYSVYFVWSKQGRDQIDTWPFLAIALGVSAVFVSVFALVTRADVGTIGARDLLLCVAVAAVPGMLGHGSMTWSLRYVPANIPPVVMLTIPLISGVLAWVFLGQNVELDTAAAGSVTLAGVLGAIRSPGTAELAAAEALDLAEEA